MCYERNDTRRQLVVSLIVCLTLVVVLILCNLFFSSKKTEHFICYFLARLLLTPVTFVSLGYCLSTTTYPSSWPYIYNGSPHLGAHFEVTATRASGESQTRTVGASVF